MTEKENKYGRKYKPGISTNIELREKVIRLYKTEKFSYSEIGRHCEISPNTAEKIVQKFRIDGTWSPVKYRSGPERIKSSNEIVQAVQYYKSRKPSIFLSEIQKRLLNDGITTRENVPSASTISNILNHDLKMSFKKLKTCAKESLDAGVQAKFDEYVDNISLKNPYTLHFFDESSVVKTSGNRLWTCTYW